MLFPGKLSSLVNFFVFGGFALRGNSAGHIEQIDSYTLVISPGSEA